MNFKVLWTVTLIAVVTGFLVGVSQTPPPAEPFRDSFEALTGIHPDSFLAAGKDCESFHQEPCRVYGGWAPKSAFVEDAQ